MSGWYDQEADVNAGLVDDMIQPRLQAERARLTALEAALERIIDGSDCMCECDDQYCCALAPDYCCPGCIAHRALLSPSEAPTDDRRQT